MDTSHIEKLCVDPVNAIGDFMKRWTNINLEMVESASEKYNAVQNFWTGLSQYLESFAAPHRQAVESFLTEEKSKMTGLPSIEDLRDYTDLFLFNVGIAQQDAGDYDFFERPGELNEELELLTVESHSLEEMIATNTASLLEWA